MCACLAGRVLLPLSISAAVSLPTWVARADTLVLDEPLDDGGCNAGACLEVSGGKFEAGTGWRITGADSRIVLDLGEPVACGSVAVTVTQFDPINSGHTGEYVNFVGIYEGTHGNNWTAAGNDETQLQIAGNCDRCQGVPIEDAWRDERMKFKGLACSWDYPECGGFPDGNRYLPPQNGQGVDWAAHLAVAWTATVAWSCAGPHYELSGAGSWQDAGSWSWHAGHPDPRPHLRYLFVGKDHSGEPGGYIADAVVVRARAWIADSCDCPAPPACGDGQCNGGEDCGSCPGDCCPGGGAGGTGGAATGGAGGGSTGGGPTGGAGASSGGADPTAGGRAAGTLTGSACSCKTGPRGALGPRWLALVGVVLGVASARARRRGGRQRLGLALAPTAALTGPKPRPEDAGPWNHPLLQNRP
jgi:hypothetical protein